MPEERIIGIKRRIKESRERRGMSVKYIAEKMGVTIMAVYKWESTSAYRLILPSLDNVIQFCEVLNVSTDYILLGK